MKGLDKSLFSTGANGLKPKEGARRRLSSNSVGTRVPSLEFNPNSELISEDAALDYLAEILVEIFLHNQNANRNDSKEESLNLLSGSL